MFGLRRIGLPRRHPLQAHAARVLAAPESAASSPRPAAWAREVPAWLPALLLLVVALLPRSTQLNDFYTTDEAYFWQGRVARFSAALSMGDWTATNQTGHPGVTTMWLGSLGQRIAAWTGAPPPAHGNGAGYLAALRLPLAVANGLAVMAGYLLLRRLLRPSTALLAGLFWAMSPFLIAHGRLLHLDGLLASLMSLSLLCLLVATHWPRGSAPWSLAASGLLAGLALLTKAPALLLLPVSATVLLGAELPGGPNSWQALRGAAARAALRFALWLGAAAIVILALWPALWVSPAAALGAVIEEIVGNGAQPHNAGNYFMGQPVADPGWPFYISVVAWRGEVPTLLGLAALLAIGAYRLLPARRPLSEDHGRPAPSGDEERVVVVMGGFALLFALALTLLAKKFDRYLLPAWPALQILAAIGLSALLDLAAARSMRLGRAPRYALGVALAGGLAAAVALPPLLYRPYYLSYYNPLLGGGTTAQAVLLAGWGEGMEQAGAWLNARPDVRRGPVLSWLPATLAPFMPPDVAVYDLDLDRLVEPANYAVVYSSVAERDTRAVAEAYALQTPPLFTLRVHGISYITIHQLPRPFERSVGAVFSGIHLRGYSRELSGSTLVITPSWDIQLAQEGGVFSFVHLIDAQGRRVAQIDALIDDGMFATWQAGQQFGTPLPLVLPPDLPPGRYQVVLGLYRAGGERLPLTYGEPLPEPLAGPSAIDLFTVDLNGATAVERE